MMLALVVTGVIQVEDLIEQKKIVYSYQGIPYSAS